MNKHLLRGLAFLIIGVLTTTYSLSLMQTDNNTYKIVMILGVLCFGGGVILTMNSLFRKIDRNTLQQHRRDQQKSK